MASKPSVGGQAVLEGVMMRGAESWAVAVRKPDSEIAVETYPLPGRQQKHPWLKWVFIRGVYVLYESLSIGFRALNISAKYALGTDMGGTGGVAAPLGTDQRAPEAANPPNQKDESSDKALGWGMAVALPVILAIFIAAPALVSKLAGSRIGVDTDLMQNVLEGIIRISFFVGYILLISLIPDIRRTFQYHGAEHKTIYAYENEDPLTPEVVDRYSTLHVRCGTNFLFILLFITIIGHFVADVLLQGQPIVFKIAARIGMIPVLAGSSYELIRAAGRNDRSWFFRGVSLPGLAMQKITTRPPSHDQIEVAIKAMEAVTSVRPAG